MCPDWIFQGIYRVSGVKSKVEKLCQSFETEEGQVDLADHNPNVIANVLKLYLRQVSVNKLWSNLHCSCFVVLVWENAY